MKELSLLRRVKLFREHEAMLKNLKDFIDWKKIRRESKYFVLNNNMPLVIQTTASGSSADETENGSPRKVSPVKSPEIMSPLQSPRKVLPDLDPQNKFDSIS